MNLKQWTASAGALVLAAISFSACKPSGGASPDGTAKPGEVIKISYSVFFPPTHVQCTAATNWAHAIQRRSGGRVQITVYPAGSLTRPTSVTKASPKAFPTWA